MGTTLQHLKDVASELPSSERAALAHYLLQSLDNEPEDEGWAEAWRDELDRRLKAIRSGEVIGVPVESVLARLRERYP